MIDRNYLDSSLTLENRVNSLMKQMSLEEKINQIACRLLIASVPEIEETLPVKNGIGQIGVMSGRSSAAEQAKMVQRIQERVIASSRFGIPAILHCEALSGMCFDSSLVFPTSISLGATFEPEIVRDMAERTKLQMKAIGIRQALSPVLDISRDLRWGRQNETYGNDPTLVTAMSCAFIEGMQGEELSKGIAATAKHFLGYSSTEGGINMAKTVLTRREIREVYAKPFEAAIRRSKLAAVMNSYSEIDGRPICASKKILNDLLRKDLGFEGLVVSDYSSIERLIHNFHVSDNMTDAAIQCLKAGLDVELPNGAGYNECLVEAVQSGILLEEEVDAACRRSLELKFKLGIFENPYPEDSKKINIVFDNTENDKAALKAARKAMTLTKNDGILPLNDKNVKIAVIGPTGNSLRKLWSGYSAAAMDEMLMLSAMSMAGVSTDTTHSNEGMSVTVENPALVEPMVRSKYPMAKTIFEAICELYPRAQYVEGCDYKEKGDTDFTVAVELAKKADLVIVTVGGKNGWGAHCTIGEAFDSSDISLPGNQEALLQAVGNANPNFIVVHTDARPFVSDYAYKNAKAILEGWLCCNHAGRVIAETISGQNNPGGRLQLDVPVANGVLSYHYQQNASHYKTIQDMGGGAYVNLPKEIIARPFGYGLSYTKFTMENEEMEISEGETPEITIRIEVKNIGSLSGDKVIQLYGKDVVGSVTRPYRELLGFQRVSIKPGEKRQIEFRFNLDIMAFEDEDYKWICEAGEYLFFVADNCEDERICLKYILQNSMDVNPANRTFFAETNVR